MATDAKKPTAPKPRDAVSWSSLQMVAFTLIGALSATVLSNYGPLSTSNPQTEIVEIGVPVEAGNVSPVTEAAPKIKILSFDPFIAHIADFISPSEREHLLKLGQPLLKESIIRGDDGQPIKHQGRTSSTAFLPETDPVVVALTQRAAEFQGYLSPADIDIQITSYNPGQQYKHHFDWYPPPRARNRISTFFTILKSTCDNCGTEFPFINITERAAFDKRWCDALDCSKELLTTKNVEGSALFWVNLDEDGQGRMDTLHAGLPALNGDKVGLNIWTDIDTKEVMRRGMFKTQSKHFYNPTQEFLEKHGMTRNED